MAFGCGGDGGSRFLVESTYLKSTTQESELRVISVLPLVSSSSDHLLQKLVTGQSNKRSQRRSS
ncbi:hypothetical protein Hanom_Chr04g00305611 [Helianthus anomalus]